MHSIPRGRSRSRPFSHPLGRARSARGARCALGLALCAATFAAPAHAGLIVTGSVGGAQTGAHYVNFDGLPLGNAGSDLGDFTIAFTGTAEAVRGNLSGRYAAPYLSGNNGQAFGTANGADTTTYLSTGVGTILFAFDHPQTYFGLLWGSVDGYNSVDFLLGDTLVGRVTGSDVTASPNGNQGVNGTLYVNVNSPLPFDRVLARSTSYAFEFDNVSYDGPAPASFAPDSVPAPPPAPLLGLGLLAIGLVARRALRKPRQRGLR